jgi:hypothetical protein
LRGPGQLPPGRPHPALKAVGFYGTIPEFNNRLRQVVDAHRAAKGFDPSPGLALDVVRSPVDPAQYTNLFSVGASRIGARAQKIAVSSGLDRSIPKNDRDLFLKQYFEAKSQGFAGEQFLQEHEDELKTYLKDKGFRDKFVRQALVQEKAQAASVVAMTNPASVISRAIGFGALAGKQISQGLVVGPPTLVWEEGKAVTRSVGQRSLKPLAKTNVGLAKGIVRGVGRDITHPGENPGYLFLDVFGLASAGAGIATRLGRAGAAAARGEGGAAARNLVERPRGGRIEMRKGGATEQRLGSENMLVNAVQRLGNERANRRMEIRSGGDPAGVLSVVRPLRARDILERVFEPLRMKFGDEAKFRRERQARLRVESTLAMGLRRDLDNISRWSERTSQVFGKLPEGMRRGLSVGEQKALQVITLDDPNPLAAWRSFHRRMIEQGIGDAAGHRAHLAALDLAEKALTNPSKRFKQAATKMYEVLAEQERLKMEVLGLLPDIGDRRIIAAGQVVRSGEQVAGARAGRIEGQIRQLEGLLKAQHTQDAWRVAAYNTATVQNKLVKLRSDLAKARAEADAPAERQSASSIYMPFFSRARSPRRPSERNQYPALRDAGYGYGPPQGLTELKHQFTGESIRIGDFRIDATNLAGESYGRTVQLVSKIHQYKSIWDASTATKKGPFDGPVRDIREIRDRLREVLDKADEGLITEKDAAVLKPQALDDLNRFLYPDESDKIPNVRWADPALFDIERAPIPSAVKAAGQLINEPARIAILFLRVAYILNAVGNAGMVVLHQGHHAPPNMLRAMFANTLYGDKITRTLDELGGETRSISYVTDRNLFGINIVGRALAHGWTAVADRAFRRAAVIHELRRLGYDLPLGELNRAQRAEMERILSPRASAKEKADVIEASRRGNKAMVEFDNLAWVERELLKQFIFVYPWVSRSLVWSLRSVVEHPVKADILAQIGAEAEQEHPEIYKNVPAWFKQGGYIPVGFDSKGAPVVVNPTSVNSFSTLSQMLSTAQAGFVNGAPGTEYDTAYEMLGPMAKFLVRGISGTDEYGNAYPGSDWAGAAMTVLNNLPQVTAVRRSGKKNPPETPVDLASRESLLAHYRAGLRRTVFSPGWADGFGMLVSGGLTPRSVDQGALQARQWQEFGLAKRHALERRLLQDALKEQSSLLKEPVTGAVKDAVGLASEMSWAAAQKSKELGRTVTIGTLERTLLDINTLVANHRIPPDQAALLRKKARGAETKADQTRFHSAIMDKYAGAKALQEWDDSVRFVASFTKENLQARLHALGDLTETKRVIADQGELYEAGRQALKFRREVKRRTDEAGALPSEARGVESADFRAWLDLQDKPIKVDGKVVAPSPVRLDWADTPRADREAKIRSLSQGTWASMSNFEKEIVGKRVASKVSAAWAIIAKLKADYKRDNYVAATADQVVAVVKQMDKQGYEGILRDYIFSIQPTIHRFEVLKPYTDLPMETRREFDRLVGNDAKKAVAAITSGNYSAGDVRQAWKNYVATSLQAELVTHPKLKTWLEPFGPNFLPNLLGK